MRFGCKMRCWGSVRSSVVVVGAWLLVVLGAVWAAADEPMRQWVDRTGKHKLTARLQSFEQGKATLELSGGKLMEIELFKLSVRDQQYVVQHAMGLKKPKEDSPFKEKEKTGDTESAPEETADGIKQVAPDWSKAELVQPMPENAQWKFATPIAGPASGERRPRAIQLPPRQNFFEGCDAVIANNSGQRILVGYSWDFNRPQPQTRLILCDLVRGKTLMTAATVGKGTPLALSDNGGLVLMTVEKDHKGHLELWGLAPRGITKLWRLGEGNEANAKWAAFLDNERFAVLLESGKLGVLKATAAEPLYSAAVDGFCTPALSPDRKYLAVAQSDKISVIDLAAGRTAAVQNTSQLSFPRLCFSPDGSRLACADFNNVRVWNFADGSLYREFPVTALPIRGQEVVWPQDRYLLFNMQQLIDLESQVQVWSYSGGEKAVWANGLCAFVVGERGNQATSALVTAPVPPANLSAMIAKAMQEPDFYVLKSGTTVTLNLSGLPDATEQEKAAAALTKKLEANGMKVGPGGSIELVGGTETGKDREISYHGFGVNPWQRHTVREYLTTLKFIYQGTPVWQTSTSSVPFAIQLKEGETINQVLRASEKPNYKLFETVELPKLLAKPSAKGGLGSTRVTASGAE
jgi:hypothetical protein